MEFRNVDSWKQYIKNKSMKLKISPQELQQSFLLECFARKIGGSKFREELIFKGGLIMSSLMGINTRSTRDIDLTWISNEYSMEEISKIIVNLNDVNIGIPITFEIQSIKENNKSILSKGYQITLKAIYESMKFNLKLDIANGTLIYPEAIEYAIKSNFDNSEISVLSYSIENIIAEKYETILDRGDSNGRMRDFFDIYMIYTIGYDIDIDLLNKTIVKVSQDRGTLDKISRYEEILDEIKKSNSFMVYWKDYCKLQSRALSIDTNEIFDVLTNIGKGFSYSKDNETIIFNEFE